jgi:2-phosphosulfolactate phosphatase
MEIDVALVPGEVRHWLSVVSIMVDELRASSTITTVLDLGCKDLVVTATVAEARRVAAQNGGILAGERHGITPEGFDSNNSPTELARFDLQGRSVVLSSSNGTSVLSRLRRMPVVLVGCLLNARACAAAALDEAVSRGLGIGIVCAGRGGLFALDDCVAAGLIVQHLAEAAEARGIGFDLSDTARAAVDLHSAYPDEVTALERSASGRVVREVGGELDMEFCARADSSWVVPILRVGRPLRIESLGGPGVASRARGHAVGTHQAAVSHVAS